VVVPPDEPLLRRRWDVVKVLILHSWYRSGAASGENRVVEDEARLLSEAGHQVDVFAPRLGQPSGLRLLSAGLGMIWSRDAIAEVRRRIDRGNPDIVHCHNLFPALSPAVLRAIEWKIPVVATLHNYRLLCLPGTFLRDGRICEDCAGRLPWPGVLHRCYQGSFPASVALASSLMLHGAVDTFAHIRLYLAISDFVRRKHIEGGLAPERIVVKPHFAWGVQRREGPGEYFLYLGRLSPEKGVSTLLEAWRGIRASLLVVGDGPDASRLRAIAPPNVEFRGTVAADRVPQVLLGARAVLAPSLSHEGAGKVVLEAYAAGVPVLVSRAGGLPEAVHDGLTGLVLPPRDIRSWIGAVERLLEDSESERMGKAGWEVWAEHYTPKRALLNLEGCYQKAMD
jgi:glycosyltransferase involved in cell wall biosynthesis